MPEFSDEPLANLIDQVRAYSPNSTLLLFQMREECGKQAAYYAAFILIWLQATTESEYNKPLNEYTSADFEDFAFFEVTKDNEHALALFDRLLRTYQQDQMPVGN